MSNIPVVEKMKRRQALQAELERLFNKNQLMSRIRGEFINCEEFDFTKYCLAKGINPVFGIDLLAQMALHKRANIATLVGCLRHHFNDGQATADQLLLAAEADLVDWDSNFQVFIVKFELSADVQEELDRYQFPLPMVVKPKYVRHNLEVGYFNSKGSIILRDNHTNDDVCLDHINRMNAIKLTINTTTAKMIKNKWRNLDKVKPGETRDDFERRKKAFEKYDRTSHAVMGLLTQEGNEIHLTHKFDKRGRTYCQGYHVSYQGNAWNKAVVEFFDKEVIPV